MEFFQQLGFQVKHSKSLRFPQQELEFLGVLVSPAFSLPPDKFKGLETKATQLLKKSFSQALILARKITQFIGTANAAAVAIPPVPLLYRSFQRTKHHFQRMERAEHSNSTVREQQRGVELVDTSSNPLESPELADSSPPSQVYNRCLHVGMGGSLPESNNWWPLVPDGNQLSYQLPRTTGCLSNSSVLYQKSSSPIDHLFSHGQYNSQSLSQSQGRNIISPTVQPCQTNMGVVHVSEHHTSGQSHTRPPEHNSRQRISNSTGQMGLVITPQLQRCSWPCGEKNPTSLTTYSFTSGNAAGVDTGGCQRGLLTHPPKIFSIPN